MKCSSECKFLTTINSKGKLFCTRTGWDISDIPKEILDSCPKFIEQNYIRHDILISKY
jgi:hypothetical protein